MARNRNRKGRGSKKRASVQEIEKTRKGEKDYRTSKFKKDLADKNATINYQKEKIDSLEKDIDSLKKDIKIKDLKERDKVEPVVILDERKHKDVELEKVIAAQRDLNRGTIQALQEYRIKTTQAETESIIKIIEAEKNSPEAQQAFYKLKMKSWVHVFLIIVGLLIMTGIWFHPALSWPYAVPWVLVGGFFASIGIAHFTTNEGIEKAEKLTKLFPLLPKQEKKGDNRAIEHGEE